MNAKKKEKTRRETTAIKVWVTPAEKAAITVKADAYSLSASTYLRELALRSTRPPTRPGEKINHRGKRTDLQRVRTNESAKKSGVRGRRSGSLEGEPLAKSSV